MGAPRWPPYPPPLVTPRRSRGAPRSPYTLGSPRRYAMGMLDGKVAVVTGGGTGIGRAVSIGLAAAGAAVVVNDYGVGVDGRDPSSEPANEVVATIRKTGGRAVASPESVATMAGGRNVVNLALKELGD